MITREIYRLDDIKYLCYRRKVFVEMTPIDIVFDKILHLRSSIGNETWLVYFADIFVIVEYMQYPENSLPIANS